jgi:Flp pilus assembly protein TadD
MMPKKATSQNQARNRNKDLKNRSYILFLNFLFLAGIIFRCVYLWQFSFSPLFDLPIGPDVEEYYNWALEIISGNFLWNELRIHSPAYPFYLAFLLKISSFNFFLTRLLQEVVVLTAGLLMFYFLLLKDNENRSENFAGISASILWTFYLPLVYLSGEFVCEAMLVPVLCFAVIFFNAGAFQSGERKNIFIFSLCGVFSALAILIHPLSILFIVAEFAILYFKTGNNLGENTIAGKNRNHRAFFTAVIVFLIILFPIFLFNGIKFGKIFPFQSNGGFNFYLGNNLDADGTCYIRPGPEWDKIHSETEFASSEAGISKDTLFTIKSMIFIKNNTLKWAGLLLKKSLLVWNKEELVSGADYPAMRCFTPIQSAWKYPFAIIGSLALTGFFLALLRKNVGGRKIHFSVFIAAFWLSQLITVTSSRYRISMLPGILFFSSYMPFIVLQTKEKRWKIISLAIFFASCAVVWLFPAPRNQEREKSEAFSVLGEAFLKKGDIENAEKLLLNAVEYEKNWSRNYNLLGIIAENKGDVGRARELFIIAANCPNSDNNALMNLMMLYEKQGETGNSDYLEELALRGNKSADLFYNCGLRQQRRGHSNKAISFYQKALEKQPFHQGTLNNYGVIMIIKGEFAKATELFKKALRVNKNNPDVSINLVISLYEDGKKQEAVNLLSRVEKQNHLSEDLKEKLNKIKSFIP